MTTIILFDGKAHQTLKPFTWTRPVSHMRLGGFTLAEKWSQQTCLLTDCLTQTYLQPKYPIQESDSYIYIAAYLLPNERLVDAILALSDKQVLLNTHSELIAFKSHQLLQENQFSHYIQSLHSVIYTHEIKAMIYPEYFVKENAQAIVNDFEFLKQKQINQTISSSNVVLGNQLLVAQGVQAQACTFNTTTGPIIIGENALIMEGSHLRGPIYIGANAVVKMGSKIYGGTTIGAFCIVGSEVKNSIFMGYSNKGHDGYIGDAMIGEWCNLGAGTSNSNMKNNLKNIRLWDYESKGFRDTGMMFCGLMMGDFSMSALHTAFNTGTVVGVGANVICDMLTEKFIPDFTWRKNIYNLDKFLETIEILWNRKKIELDSVNKLIFSQIFHETREFREQ